MKLPNGKAKERTFIAVILGLFIFLGTLYALVTPVFEASDELWHYPMIDHLADGNPLPVQVMDPELAGPWKQEASQPPLYYYLGAALTFWIDRSDLHEIRWLNPHVDNGVLTEDGNNNLVIHGVTADPWSGTQLAVRIVRLFSVLLGAFTIYLTYRIAKKGFPKRPEIALGAAAVNAFIPMFVFISGAINNDNLIIPLASLSLLIMVYISSDKALSRNQEIRLIALLGLVIGLAALSKISALGLIVLAAFAIFMGRWIRMGRNADLRGLVHTLWSSSGRLVIVLVIVALISGWWYLRNVELYGDWRGWNAFIAVLGQRAHPASLAQLWDERWGFMLSFWGLFGGLNIAMPEWIYRLLNAIVILSVIGFIIYLFGIIRDWVTGSYSPVKGASSLIKSVLEFVERHIVLMLCLLWAAAIIVGLVQWATITWSSQGRLVFSAISALSILFVVGLVGWMSPRMARIVLGLLTGFLFIVALFAPILWIGPAYQVNKKKIDIELITTEIVFDKKLKLNAYGVDVESVQPGELVNVWLLWESLTDMKQDWSVFVHLNDPVLQAPIAQRDMYPGQGLRATSLMQPGETILNRYAIRLPETAVAPSDLSLNVGLYDFSTGRRLKSEEGIDSVELTQMDLQAIPGSVPNPVTINFENELELVGYDLDNRYIEPGEEINLNLYWRAYDRPEEDYTFFAQLLDSDTTRWASQDIQTQTSNWEEGDLQIVTIQMTVAQDAPSGVYPIIVGAYTRPVEGGFERLQHVIDGRLADDFVSLTSVRIGEL
jgi:hypothetical protein